SGHNPVLMLGSMAQERLQELAQDDAFFAHLDAVVAGLRDYMASPRTWYQKQYGTPSRPLVAYFSLEFCLTESLPIYSGGLGILAGDHLKSASELGVPLIGVGLLYQKGYFRQYLTSDGWQQERHPSNDFSVMPLRPVYADDGTPVRVRVELAGRPLLLRLWNAQVGRVTLVLLDANIPGNPPDLQDITGQLYGGDSDMRIRQEIVLGVGGIRALHALGLRPRGVHPQSWISNEMRHIYNSYLGPGWAELAGDTRVWRRSAQVPTDELWRTHERRRERLVRFTRRRLALQLRLRGASVPEVAEAEQ